MGASDLANRGKQRQRQAQLMRSMSWQPGMPLTEAEERLLRPLREAARTLGRTPVYREVTEALQIKAHFRTWNLAIQAAGLPALTSPEQTQIRALECEREKCGKALEF